jgi:hypothetical protein
MLENRSLKFLITLLEALEAEPKTKLSVNGNGTVDPADDPTVTLFTYPLKTTKKTKKIAFGGI